MDLKQIAATLAVPLHWLIGAPVKPTLTLIQGGKVDKPKQPE